MKSHPHPGKPSKVAPLTSNSRALKYGALGERGKFKKMTYPFLGSSPRKPSGLRVGAEVGRVREGWPNNPHGG